MRPFLILIFTTVLAVGLASSPSVLHFTISRRGGAIRTGQDANLDALAAAVRRTEVKYGLTHREVEGNKLVRKPKQKGRGGKAEMSLMTEVGEEGRWYAMLELGQPTQRIEMDLDMLSYDFYVMSTTSREGTAFDVFKSQSYFANDHLVHPLCESPTDMTHLPTINKSIPLLFPNCKPARYSRWTLTKSGAVLGLAPSDSLKQIDCAPLMQQLLDNKIIEQHIWSVTLINGKQGILSIGGSMAAVVQHAKTEADRVMTNLGKPKSKRKVVEDIVHAIEDENSQKTWRDEWKWSAVQGAQGWWQILLEGVWIDGSKALKNQPAVIDLNSPFILAPPLAARKFYESVPSSYRLPAPHDQFYVFPCLNPPVVHFEFGHWLFPAFQGSKGANYSGTPGGKLSLGRLRQGSGFCVGAVVETRMGVRDERDRRTGGTVLRGNNGKLLAALAGEIAGNGMRDVWVIGESFFRGVGGVFDFKEMRVGFKTY